MKKENRKVRRENKHYGNLDSGLIPRLGNRQKQLVRSETLTKSTKSIQVPRQICRRNILCYHNDNAYTTMCSTYVATVVIDEVTQLYTSVTNLLFTITSKSTGLTT